MKKAFIVYYADKTANVVIADDYSGTASIIPPEKLSEIVKIDLIPFEVL